MKKGFVAQIIAFALFFALAGCGGSGSSTTTASTTTDTSANTVNTDNTATNTPTAQPTNEPTAEPTEPPVYAEPENTPEPTDVPEPETEDDVDKLTVAKMTVTKQVASEKEGFYIKTGEDYIDIGIQVDTGIIQRCPTHVDTGNLRPAYNSIFQTDEAALDFPVLSGDDELVYFNSKFTRDIILYPITETYYTVGLTRKYSRGTLRETILFDADDMYRKIKSNMVTANIMKYGFNDINTQMFFTDTIQTYPNDVAINDSSWSDLQKEGFIPLEKDEIITLSWYEGTQYQEATKTANHLYHIFDYDRGATIACELTREGYGTFDISQISDGMYVILQEYDNSVIGIINRSR